MRLTKNILIAFAVILLSGCGNDTPEQLLSEYQSRVANVLEAETPSTTQTSNQNLTPFPDKRDRMIKTIDLRQGLWEVLDFKQCDMLSIISQRNSSLGKVMPASQKMRYELRLINALQRCKTIIANIETPTESQQAFQARLEKIYQLKRTNLPAEIWNGIYASAEISKHFKSSASPFPLDHSTEQNNSTQIHSTLKKLTHLSSFANSESTTLPSWLEAIEDEYATLHHSNFGSQVLATLPLMTAALNQVAGGIETRLSKKPFCYPNHQPQRATVLNNVFRKYYVQQVQPYMALLEREAKPWLEQHNIILDRLPVPPAMQAYSFKVLSMQNPDGLWNQWVSARDRHSKAWQTILGQCNMMPGV